MIYNITLPESIEVSQRPSFNFLRECLAGRGCDCTRLCIEPFRECSKGTWPPCLLLGIRCARSLTRVKDNDDDGGDDDGDDDDGNDGDDGVQGVRGV